MKPTVALVGIVAALLSAVAPTQVSAQGQSALEVVERLNEEAMEAYLNMDIERAGSMLEEALRVAREGGVGGMPFAQTNLNLGVIYVGGLGESQNGAGYFLMAICAAPGIQLDPLNSTPEMQQAFADARQQAQSGGCPTGAGPAPTNNSGISPSAVTSADVPLDAMDDETPWANSGSAGSEGDFRRFYFQLSFTLGIAYIYPGMKPDRSPPDSAVYGTYDPNDTVSMPPPINGFIQDPTAAFYNNINPPAEDSVRTPFQLLTTTPWVADGNTVDDLGPLTGACKGDGVETGPAERLVDPMRKTDLNYLRSVVLPSKYCVRVNSAGFANTIALRTGIGYFVTESIGLGLVGRLQLGAGAGTLANFLFGPRVEFMLSNVRATGPSVSMFLGATMGQIQIASPTPFFYQDPTTGQMVEGDAPFIVSGLFGAHLGFSTRWRLHPNFGLVFAPELDVQFPDFLVNLDLPLGVEAAF